MATNQDIKYVYGVYLKDLEYFCSKMVNNEKPLTSGDLVFVTSNRSSAAEEGIVLGYSGNKQEAKAQANEYMVQLGKIHRTEDLASLELGETQML